MAERWQFWSAVTVRLGIAAGGVLGGFAGYWIVAFSTPGEKGLLAWPTAAGADGARATTRGGAGGRDAPRVPPQPAIAGP